MEFVISLTWKAEEGSPELSSHDGQTLMEKYPLE